MTWKSCATKLLLFQCFAILQFFSSPDGFNPHRLILFKGDGVWSVGQEYSVIRVAWTMTSSRCQWRHHSDVIIVTILMIPYVTNFFIDPHPLGISMSVFFMFLWYLPVSQVSVKLFRTPCVFWNKFKSRLSIC